MLIIRKGSGHDMMEIQCVAANPRPEKKAKTANKLGVLEKVLRWFRRGPSSQAGPKSAGCSLRSWLFSCSYERCERLEGKIVSLRLLRSIETIWVWSKDPNKRLHAKGPPAGFLFRVSLASPSRGKGEGSKGNGSKKLRAPCQGQLVLDGF